ncbi:MAG: sterol desaturase family protein [Oricola sp.]|jgi:sterol desaturase/sphingolipid hydroxylase (fatty acid hydroxylase superfamily)|nr:sterol desaturase family protein [Oricola sp.]
MHAISQAPLLAAVALSFIVLEIALRVRPDGRGYDFRGAAASFGVFAGNIIIGAAVSTALIAPVYLWCWSLVPVKLPFDDWRVWAAGFLALEFVYYWEHRFSHTVRWLWAAHAVHHTPNTLSLPTALRLGWTNALSGGWLFFAPLILVGFNPLMIGALFAFNLRFQFLLHTELVGKLGPLELVFNTPSHHRVHHASNPDYLDKNFGGVLIIFDRLFGTFAEEKADEEIRYGLVSPVRSNNPFVIALQEWGNLLRDAARSRSPAALARSLFGRPGETAPAEKSEGARNAGAAIC